MSIIILCIPFAAAACFGLAGPTTARRLPPRQATWLLSAGATLAAVSSLAVLLLLVATLVGQQPEIAREGNWSATALTAHAPVDRSVGALALLAALTLSALTARAGLRHGVALLSVYRASGDLPAATGELVVVSTSVAAYAVPGRPGHVVVSRSLLAALSSRERQAVLEHERAHLAHGHHWHVTAVTLAASLNPLLIPLRTSVEHAVERWADEAAAAVLGDRRLVADALIRTAAHANAVPLPALALASRGVRERVVALLEPPPQPRHGLLTATGLLLVAAATAAVISTKQVEHLFELARHLAAVRAR